MTDLHRHTFTALALPLAVALATACGGGAAPCPDGSVPSEGRCVNADAGTDAAPAGATKLVTCAIAWPWRALTPRLGRG